MIESVEDSSSTSTKKGEHAVMPEWFTELFSRLSQVFTKLLIKLGLKIIF